METKINMNDNVSIELTEYGAKLLNFIHSIKNIQEPYIYKIDYKPRDKYTNSLFNIIILFGKYIDTSSKLIFRNLTKE